MKNNRIVWSSTAEQITSAPRHNTDKEITVLFQFSLETGVEHSIVPGAQAKNKKKRI